MKILRYKKTTNKNEYVELRLLNNYNITKSSQEVAYSDLTCDFTDLTVNDLPEKYQEVEIINNNQIEFFGYVDSYNFNTMREIDKFTEINITLLSPMKMATLRTFVAIGTYQLVDLIQNVILSPLINDGFKIGEINITDRTLSVNFLSNTVEYGLNMLSNNYNIWWFIDEQKNIYIKDISTMLNQETKHIYDKTHRISGLQYIKPEIISDNYANVINFSNVRVYENSDWQYLDGAVIVDKNGLLNEQITTTKANSQIDFKYPVDIKKENIKKAGESYTKKTEYYGIRVFGTYSDNTKFEFYVKYDVENNNYTLSNNLGFDGDENTTKDFLLIRDSFFNNLITGFKYNNENKNLANIEIIQSDSALIWNIYKFYNDKAINEKKGLINDTGIVELTIDMKEQWKTKQELREIGLSYMNNNSLKLDGEITLKLDKKVFNIGETIKINIRLFNDNYIITKIQENFSTGITEYLVTCKNSNIADNYINLFRTQPVQEEDSKIYQISISHYSEEGIKETFEVIQ